MNPSDPYNGYFLGRTYLLMGEADKAIPYLREAALYIPDYGEARQYLEEAYDKAQAKTKDRQVFDKSLSKRDSKNQKDLSKVANEKLNQGVDAYRAKNYASAAKYFEEAVEDSPEAPKAWYYLGISYRELGKLEASRRAFEKVIKLDGANAKAYIALGHYYYDEAVYDKAGSNYIQAIDLGEEDADVYYNLGNSYFKLDNYPKAILNYKKAVKLKPDDSEIYYNLGTAQQKNRNLEDAISSFEQSWSLDPERLAAGYQIALCYIENEQPDQAIAVAKETVAKNDKFALGYLALAKAYEIKGDNTMMNKYKKKVRKLDKSLLKG